MHLISLLLLSRQFNYVTISKFCTTAFCKHLVNTPCPWLLRLRLFQGNTWNFVCTLFSYVLRVGSLKKLRRKWQLSFFELANMLICWWKKSILQSLDKIDGYFVLNVVSIDRALHAPKHRCLESGKWLRISFDFWKKLLQIESR